MPAWGLRRARRAWGLLPLLGALAALAVGAPAASALVVYDNAVHKSFSVVPALAPGGGIRTPGSVSRAALAGMSCTTDCSALSYHNGPVQHGETVYLLFWAPSSYSPAFPASYVSGMGTWVNDLAAANGAPGNPISVNTQYYDLSGPGGSKSYVPYSVTNAGTLTDTDAYPSSGCTHGTTCLTDAQIKSELSTYVTAHSLPAGLNVEYFVMLPQGVNSCFTAASSSCSYTQFCAYHSSMTVSGTQVTYADMPWGYGAAGCDVNSAFGAGYPNSDFVDPVVGVFSHELSETMTDPLVGTGWVDSSGNEIGDKCAYTYGSGGHGSMTGMNSNGHGYWNVRLGSDVYLLQQEFDNQILNCASRLTETWTGTGANGSSASRWSNATNWAASIAPGAGSASNDVVHTLSFPALGGGTCAAGPPSATCYTSSNDLTSLSAFGLSVDGGSGYSISGNALTLGAGGITSATSAISSNPSSFSPAITLAASQTWSIDGGAHNVGQLTLGGAVSGSSDSVSVNLSNAGSLVLGGDDEVGSVAITGANSANTGSNAAANGSVTVYAGLNGSDGGSVSLTDAALLAPGTLSMGGLTSVGGGIEVGRGTVPAGTLTVQGGVAIDAASRLKLFVDQPGPAGLDYSQLFAHGNVTLGGSLVLSSGGTCPSLTLGDQYTLITTTGSLSGTFSGVPNGQQVQLSCVGTPPSLQINYTANSVTATVMSLSPPWNTALPAISGTPQQGQTLTLTQGQWTNTPSSINDQWESCDSSGANCSAIPGATSSTYMPAGADVGHTIRVQEAATNAAGTGVPVASTQTAAVTAAGGNSSQGGSGAGGSGAGGSGAGGSGGGGSGGGGSTGGGSGGGAGTLTPGTPSVSGSLVNVPITCSGAVGTRCAVTVTLTITETARGGTVIAVRAAARGRHKKNKARVLVVGGARLTLSAGQSQVVRVVLNAAGQHLLTLRQVLTANLAVVQAGQRISASTVTFHGKSNRRRRAKR
jgi:hypothetical protein